MKKFTAKNGKRAATRFLIRRKIGRLVNPTRWKEPTHGDIIVARTLEVSRGNPSRLDKVKKQSGWPNEKKYYEEVMDEIRRSPNNHKLSKIPAEKISPLMTNVFSVLENAPREEYGTASNMADIINRAENLDRANSEMNQMVVASVAATVAKQRLRPARR